MADAEEGAPPAASEAVEEAVAASSEAAPDADTPTSTDPQPDMPQQAAQTPAASDEGVVAAVEEQAASRPESAAAAAATPAVELAEDPAPASEEPAAVATAEEAEDAAATAATTAGTELAAGEAATAVDPPAPAAPALADDDQPAQAAAGSRPASASAPPTDGTAAPSEDVLTSQPAAEISTADAPPSAGSRPASATANPAETPSSVAVDATATASNEAAASPAEADAAPASSSRPESASLPAAATPASEPSPAVTVDTAEPPAASSRPTSAGPAVPQLQLEERPGSAAAVSASPRQPASARGAKIRMLDSNYDPEQFAQAVDAAVQLPAAVAPTVALLSLDVHRRNNLAYIEDDVVVMAAGNRVVFIKLPDMTQSYLPGLDGGSVGAVAVHPSRRYLAVAEKCRHRAPNVYVYSYPALQVVKVMQGGTEHAYSAAAFNDTGDQLATVGGWPDYLITLWRWEEEAIVLRSKAFSQDVYTVKFSPYFAGNILTSGTGHIRFWKMASTFTGLKLQGQLGKFGNVELSDISAFVELPDGKVLSGTETGELLLWDGGLIKVVLTRTNKKPCHEGQVHILMHDRGSNTILSGGSDGYVRLWDFNKINDAEPEEDSNSLPIAPVDEVHISPGGTIRSLLWERRHWLVLDGSGAIVKVDLPQAGLPSKGASSTRLLEFQAGGVVGAVASPVAHVAVTASRDGTVRVYDYAARRELHSGLHFNQPATCLTKLGSCATVAIVGFQDGVIRTVMRLDGALRLLGACKPHKGAVTAVSVSSDSTWVVTAGKDATLFFFRATAPGTLTPLCYTKLPAPALCASWSADQSSVLVGLENGLILEVSVPVPDTVDSTKTFEVALSSRQYGFKLPKPTRTIKRRKPKAGEDASGGKEAPTETSTPAPAEGTEGAEGAADGEEFEEVVVVDEDPLAEHEVFQVLTIAYAPSAHRTSLVHVTLNGRAAGEVWLCDLDQASDPGYEPKPAFSAPPCAPTSVCQYSADGCLLLLGTTDGMVRVQPLSKPYGAPQGPYWQASLHDLQTGRVSAVCPSFDAAYLLTAAYDGTMCLQELHLQGISPEKPHTSGAEVLLSASDAPQAAADITNVNDYTLEEAKQKAEQDALEAAAEAKKMGVREYLTRIRTEFEALLAENEAKPEAERLPRSAFEIDVGLREMVAQETARREEAARQELAWETEKRRLALAKLKKFFLDNVEVEHIMLHAIRGKQFVTTFRTARLSPEVLQELEAAKQADAEATEALKQRKLSAIAAAAAGGAGAGAAGGTGAAAGIAAATAAMSTSGVDTSGMSKADLRRLARKQREAAWAAFNATRPNDKYEDPADVAAIEEAERNMGDFKLKSDPNYVVPEEERMTPQRKRFQMLLLEETMHGARMEFNQRFLALREVKRKVISEINTRVAKLRDIQAQLGKTAAAATPVSAGAVVAEEEPLLEPLSLRPEEVPEDRETVTDADIEDFLKKKEEDSQKAAQGSALGGFAGGGGGAKAGAGAGGKPPAGAAAAKAAASGASESPAPAAASGGEDALSRMMAAVPLTDLERQLQGYHRKRLLQQKARLLEELNEMADAFDSALNLLRRDKFRLEKDLKQCEIRQLVHSQELSLLYDFDKREVVLIQKRAARHEDRNEILEKIRECSSKLEIKRTELEGLMARRAAVAADFDQAVPESDPFREPLSKIFYRKIKRSKKKSGGDSGNKEGDSEDEEEDEEDEEEGDDDDDDNDGEEVCDLREHRLDEEELVADFTKAIDALKKDRESLSKKQKLVEQSLAAINSEIAAFQQEKQAALNQIDVVVNLHMHQIEYLVDGRLPEDLGAALVFSSTQLDNLRRRIDELEDEKNDLRLRHKSLKKEHTQLLKDKGEKESRVAELEARAHDVQMLKFGQVVDLELLDALGASKGTEELRAELTKQEAAHARELAQWDARIASKTDELMALTRENTGALNAVSALTAAQRGLEAGLTATRKTMFADPVTQRRQEVEERDALVQLVNAQAKELERLRSHVMALKRKDTSVYQ